jgi:phage protein D/phage baseplate assembly protein gpV
MPQRPKLISHLFIRVNGTDLEPELMDDLFQVLVDSNLHLPDMFVIRVHDEELRWVDEGPFELGAAVEIGAKEEDSGSEQELIKGEITALEPDFARGTQAMLTVRGYDRSHRLHRGTHSRAFTQVTDSDLASQIAQQAGLSADVDSTSQVYEHVLQDNQSDMAFLRSRARRIGYHVYARDRTLHFKRPDSQASGDPLQLEWGDQLESFRPRLTLAEQIDELVVKGWDPKNKSEVTGSASSSSASPEIGESRTGAQLASSAFGSGRRIVVNWPVTSQSEADAVAQALYDDVCGNYIEADGICIGTPALQAGTIVRLESLGQRFSGSYFVTSATHLYDAEGDYRTEFSVHGRRPETLYRLLAAEPKEAAARWGGVVTAIVTNNNDSEDQGRVKLKYPWLADDVESDWARVIGAGAGDQRGFYVLPEVNDEVLVAFEHGDVNRPLVLGGLWNGVDAPPTSGSEAIRDGQVRTRIFQTRSGHKLTFVDESDAQVVLETAGGHSLLLDDDNRSIKLESSGGTVLQLDDSDGSVSLTARGSVSIESQQGLSFKAGTDIEIQASARVTIQGAMIDLN